MHIDSKKQLCTYIMQQVHVRGMPFSILVAFDPTERLTCRVIFNIRLWIAGDAEAYVPDHLQIWSLQAAFKKLLKTYPLR